MNSRPADHHEGVDLGNGWKVQGRISPNKIGTGGHFSVGYTVVDMSGRRVRGADTSRTSPMSEVRSTHRASTARAGFDFKPVQ
jgi:hypothetical protein